MKVFYTKYLLVFLVPIAYFLVALYTLDDYGINWDSPKHFIRGESYLHFILTGRRDYLDIPATPALKGAPDYVDFNVGEATNSNAARKSSIKDSGGRRSYYQSDFYTFDIFMTKHVHTHPEVNDLLLAISNYFFYQKLGFLEDLEAYHFTVVFLTFVFLCAMGLWVYKRFSIITSIIATSTLAFYPLVFSESHFNIKDPILMSFFGMAILFFVDGIKNKKPILIIFSSIFAGFAMGTKFNALFLLPILGFWFLYNILIKIKDRRYNVWILWKLMGGRWIIISILIYPLIVLGVLYIFSPYLWIDPIGNFLGIVNYYKSIGTEPLGQEMSKFLIGGWNTYPLIWIFITSPLPVLFLSSLGFLRSIYLIFRKKDDLSLLILLWFTVPIVRVMWPGANIYGGVRQIMEFIPAMAILSGIGAAWLTQRLGVLGRLGILGVIAVLLVIPIIRLHPNENVYFNELIGGLSGAKKSEIPSWGNSYGNVYLQGIEWLNENANPDAKLTLATNYLSDIPRFKLRPDIDLDNHHWSGFERGGEYAMEMYYDYPLRSRIRYAYYDTFLNPVYEVKVDGVPLLKIWKNDLKYTKRGFEKQMEIKPSSIEIDGEKIKINFKTQVFLTKLTIEHSTISCDNNINGAFIEVTKGDQNWIREPGLLIDPESPESSPGLDENIFVYLFPAREAISIILNSNNLKSCLLKDTKVNVWGLEKTL